MLGRSSNNLDQSSPLSSVPRVPVAPVSSPSFMDHGRAPESPEHSNEYDISYQGREGPFTSHVLDLVTVCEHVPIPCTDVNDGDMPWFNVPKENAFGQQLSLLLLA